MAVGTPHGTVPAYDSANRQWRPKYFNELPPGPGSTYEPSISPGSPGQYWSYNKTWQNLNTSVVPESGTNQYWTQGRFDTAFGNKTTSNLSEGTNLYWTQTRFDNAFSSKTTSNLSEGSNLYWTQTRFDTAFGNKTTSNLAEGTNLYWTQGRFDTAFSGKTTSNLAEGTNLYYTDARARNALSTANANRVTYNPATGVFSGPQDVHTSASPTFAGLTLNTFTIGGIPFISTGGAFSHSPTTFFWDSTNSRLGIGTNNPQSNLHVTGISRFGSDVLLNGNPTNLYLFDTSTGLRVSGSTVVSLQPSNDFRSSTFTTGLSGWNMSSNGRAEFEDIRARGQISSAVFVYNEVQATAGSQFWSYSASVLFEDFTTPSVLGGTATLKARNSEGGAAFFTTNSRLRIRTAIPTGVIDAWFTITAVTNNGSYSTYSVTLQFGSTSSTVRAGTAIVDLGPSGSGWITASTDGTYGASPNITFATHSGSPWSSSTLVARLGNLNGTADYNLGQSPPVHGFFVGEYGVSGKSWISVATDASSASRSGIRLGNNISTFVRLANDGSGWLANGNISWTTTGALSASGWTLNTTSFSKNEVTIAAGVDVTNPAVGSTAAWFGKAASGYVGADFRKNTAGTISVVQIIAGDSTYRPRFTVFHGSYYRVALGELNQAYNTGDTVSDSVGMKVWDSTGARIVEFSDVRNQIAGWTLSTSAFTGTGITLNSSGSASFVSGNVVLDTTGMKIAASSTYSDVAAIRWVNGANTVSWVAGFYQPGLGGSAQTSIACQVPSGQTLPIAQTTLSAINNNGTTAQFYLRTYGSGDSSLPNTRIAALNVDTFNNNASLTYVTGYLHALSNNISSLFVDSFQNRVGIGTSSPTVTLDVRRASAIGFYVGSGSNSFWSAMQIGRASADLTMGVSASAGNFVSGTVPGDGVLMTTSLSSARLWLSGLQVNVFTGDQSINNTQVFGIATKVYNTNYTTWGRYAVNYDTTYISQNAYYNGSAWFPDDTGKATSQIRMWGRANSGRIEFNVSDTNNYPDPPVRFTVYGVGSAHINTSGVPLFLGAAQANAVQNDPRDQTGNGSLWLCYNAYLWPYNSTSATWQQLQTGSYSSIIGITGNTISMWHAAPSGGGGVPWIQYFRSNPTSSSITSTNVGIGTDSPSYQLDVNGTVHYTTLVASSDRRFKTKVRFLQNVLDKVESLQPIIFQWNDRINRTRSGYRTGQDNLGLFADDVQGLFPELVSEWKLDDQITDAKAVNYERLTVILLQAVRELRAEIRSNRAEIALLKGPAK